MIVDRIARAMTGGAPRAGFTARVMAPILGQPRPGFTTRVMARLDAPEPQARATRLMPALVATAALVIATAGAALWLTARTALPLTPVAPRIAAWPYDRATIDVPPLPFDRWAPAAPRTARAPRRRVTQVTIVHIDAGGAYRIAQLPQAAPIDVRPIDLLAPAIAPLSPPPALTLSDIRSDKETP